MQKWQASGAKNKGRWSLAGIMPLYRIVEMLFDRVTFMSEDIVLEIKHSRFIGYNHSNTTYYVSSKPFYWSLTYF